MPENNNNNEDDFGFVAGAQAIDSLRKSGYKNLAYALGELVDNSIQEDATRVEILTTELQQMVSRRVMWRVHEIGILDNGNGMDALRLRRSLRLGDGDAQRNQDRGGANKQMGKFGVGLPQASISQCKRVEIWSWTSGGPSNALWTYIDLDDKEWLKKLTVPEPVAKKIPSKWTKAGTTWGDSGTLIVWSNLDRCTWRTTSSIYKNSQFLIGRMYRYHIAEGDVEVTMKSVEENTPHHVRTDKDGADLKWTIYGNDPLYLLENTFAENPPENPAFDLVHDEELKFSVPDPKSGTLNEEVVNLKFSMAKATTRQGHGYDKNVHSQGLGGTQPHGQHAKKNIGVSIVRERRELELDRNWSVGAGNQAWERWWGAEISFGRGMDETFDVTNNKQHAQALNDVAKKDWMYFAEGDEKEDEVKDRLMEEDFSLFVCMTVRSRVYEILSSIRGTLTSSSVQKKADRKKRHKGAEDAATRAINTRAKAGHVGESDKEKVEDKGEASKKLTKSLEEAGLDKDHIEFLQGQIIDAGYRTVFSERKVDTSAFFSVEKEIGSLIVYLNANHKAYNLLFQALDDIELDDDELTTDQLKERALVSHQALKLILAAWARCEDEATDAEQIEMQEMRRKWGRLSNQFIGELNRADTKDASPGQANT